MSSSQFASSIHVLQLTFVLLLPSVFGACSPIYHICSGSAYFASDGPYESNLQKLSTFLYYKTPAQGFGLGPLGYDQHPAYGLALCRGDVAAKDCRTCVKEAGEEIRKRCPYNQGAIIWYDNCLLKYSNEDFFGQIDEENKFCMWNVRDVSDPKDFNQKTSDLLRQLAKEAFVTQTMYAVGELELGESKELLYGLAQCTRDLSSIDCFKCLEAAIGQLPFCCDGKGGGRIVGGSCNIRYEVYPFFGA